MMTTTRIPALCVVFLLAVAGCDDSSVSFNYVAEAGFDLSLPVTTQAAFDLEGINGVITVTGSDTATVVTVTGTRRVRSDSQADADTRLQDLQVVTSTTDATIFVRTEQPQDTEGRTYQVDYDVLLPPDMEMNLVNVNGDIEAGHARGDAKITGVNGNIVVSDTGTLVVSNVNGNVTVVDAEDVVLSVVNGNVYARFALSPGGEAGASTVNGNVQISIPTTTSALLRATRDNGVVTVSGLPVTDVHDTGTVYTARLGDGDGNIVLKTVNGNIRMAGH
jgi:hypothetical protein